jgi:signal transduction histidine kinase
MPDKVSILLVDDRADGLLAMQAVLTCPEYNLISASSGHEALAQLYDHVFAVILLDVQMPVLNGFETANLIRQYEPAKETPIIFVTAINKDQQHIAQGYESGAVDYLFKPFDPGILKSKVRVFVELFQTREKLRRSNAELEARVSERTAELLQSNKELEQFAYVASHDLQEPLRKIITYNEILQSKCTFEGAEKDYFERMHKASLRMRTVIEDLLHFSRIGTKEVTFELVDLNEIVQEVIVDLEMKIADSSAKIDFKALPVVNGNRSQLRHLFQNLILNSIKFAKKDKPAVIVIGSRPDGQFYEMTVKDNGIGFNEKYLDRIFKPFQRLHPRHEYEGSGIGLSICQKIVQQHGGRITAKSSEGEGATFILTFPQPSKNILRSNEQTASSTQAG